VPTTDETVALLGHVGVFETLGPDDLAQVAAVAVPRRIVAGQVVFREGDHSDSCYVVCTGHCRATREHADGRTITLAQFGPGDIFGELAMFVDETRSATVEAMDDVDLVALLARDMRRFLREHNEIALELVVALGRRLLVANERIASQSFQTVQSRVATVISELATRARGEQQIPGDVVVTATQVEVAQLAGSSRESASRFLAVLERAGVVTQGRGRITVHDAGALQGYVY